MNINELNMQIFQSQEAIIEFLCDQSIIPICKTCTKCGSNAPLVFSSRLETKKVYYRCTKKGCQTKISLYTSKLSIEKYMFLIYGLLINLTYYQIKNLINVSDTTICRAKNHLRNLFKAYSRNHFIVLGGPNTVVECDESVISRRGIIRNPTSSEDNIRDTIWILGAIDNTDQKNFYLTRIPNRTVENLSSALDGKVSVGSRFYTDGYPSYPRVAENLGVQHFVVNHNHGFVSSDGTHTNNIEGFWSYLKSEMRRQGGVMRSNIDKWLEEFSFRRRYLQNYKASEVFNIFKELLKIHFA